MDSIDRWPELERFARAVTPLVADGDARAFCRAAAPLARLARSGLVAAWVRAALERSVGGRAVQAADGAGVTLLRGEQFSLTLSLIDPSSEPTSRVEALAHHLAVGVLGPGALEIACYRLPPPHRFEVLDRSRRLEGPRTECLGPGDAQAFAAGEDVIQMAAREQGTAVLMLRSAMIHRIRWVYDAATRAPILPVAADPQASRVEFACRTLARLGSAADVPALEGVVAHPDHFVRWTALQAIVELDFDRGRDLIERALVDPHPHIRSAAARFLGDRAPALAPVQS
jgi:hypothetical protein